ncbi:hypothetical protein A2U01_0054157, partial [Trifolium medium]|nr:hypothetical protein [Trifolium medium]
VESDKVDVTIPVNVSDSANVNNNNLVHKSPAQIQQNSPINVSDSSGSKKTGNSSQQFMPHQNRFEALKDQELEEGSQNSKQQELQNSNKSTASSQQIDRGKAIVTVLRPEAILKEQYRRLEDELNETETEKEKSDKNCDVSSTQDTF